MCLDIYQG